MKTRIKLSAGASLSKDKPITDTIIKYKGSNSVRERIPMSDLIIIKINSNSILLKLTLNPSGESQTTCN